MLSSAAPHRLKQTLQAMLLVATTLGVHATQGYAEAKVGQTAPTFSLPNQDGQMFNLADRQGKGWTVLYFYPKAGTPGCTKQACAFRDSIKVIHEQHAEVYGISADTVTAQKGFHTEHKLTFDLLADPDDKAIAAYGVKMPIISLAKRWTFILDPQLVIRAVDDDVDPVMDAKKTAAKLVELQKSSVAAPTTPK